MKLLFDENLSFKLCRQLSDVFPGSSQVRLAGLERELPPVSLDTYLSERRPGE